MEFPNTSISYGDVETLKPGIMNLIGLLNDGGVDVAVIIEKGELHGSIHYAKDRNDVIMSLEDKAIFGELKSCRRRPDLIITSVRKFRVIP